MKVFREETRNEKIQRLFNDLSVIEQGVVVIFTIILMLLPFIAVTIIYS